MEENILEWRFKGNGFTEEKGLDTPDMETFKKDPMASLAREICQNSIDAKSDEKNKVIIEFNSFNIDRQKIPNLDRLEAEISACYEYQTKKEIKEELNKMLREIRKKQISCLRISDFNTTGLLGVTNTDNSPFYLLTKGSGLSDKSGAKGGSKGIGKFATFVTSQFNTVFYSTYNKNNEKAYIGISKLCSALVPNSKDREKTQGIGYYGSDYKNSPILEQFSIDDNFKRTEYGTDIFILGFKRINEWKKEIITKILDSFLVAIMYDELEIKIDGILINRQTLDEIINSDLILENLKNRIKSQYILLQEKEGTNVQRFDIEGYGDVKILVKVFSREEAHLATKDCVMIRYPYMKIKNINKSSVNVPYTAMCIIGNNDLNILLRNIENPQHTDWEFKRIEDIGMLNETKNVYNRLKEQIDEFIKEVTFTGETQETDIEGASDYLPENDENNNGLSTEENQSENMQITEKPIIVKTIKNKIKSNVSKYESKEMFSAEPFLGDIIDSETDETANAPVGNNNSKDGDKHSSDNEKGLKEGDNETLRNVQLTGIKYTLFVVDKENGKYVITFNSTYQEDDCELETYYLDDGDGKYKIELEECIVEGKNVEIINGKAQKIKIHPGKMKFEIKTNLRDFYTWEVRLYANKK